MWIILTEICINIFQFCQKKCPNSFFFIFKVGGDHNSEKWEVGEVLLKYNEDDFLSIFSNYLFRCVHVYVSLLFESLVEIKIKIESRLHCIFINDDSCIQPIHNHNWYLSIYFNIYLSFYFGLVWQILYLSCFQRVFTLAY